MEPMVTCPLDKNHQILKNRLQFHLVRCKKNHDMSKKGTCEYNSTHIMDKHELQAHHLTCIDRYEIEEKQYSQDEENCEQWKGILSVQDVIKACENLATYGDNWDNDPEVETYDPHKANENKEIITGLIVASKSAKKAFRNEQRRKMAQFDSPKVSKVATAKVHVSAKPQNAPKTGPSISTKDKPKGVDRSEKKNQKASTVADQLAANMKFLNICEKKTEDFPALKPPKSFSSIVKERKTSKK
ncbi:uncharacterized protein [Fopius arisanus]|uniref:Uncharacterized protein isoform X2 n=1 Tax=Fopius arisanus TaxID=64838 RepID=A0A9R1TA46_9HYME|nr:PREDICTED: uncharacterized protein LOC105267921 isoform X2 [Fopius arisanus]